MADGKSFIACLESNLSLEDSILLKLGHPVAVGFVRFLAT